MSFWRQLTGGLRVLTRRADADRDLDDELRHYAEESARAHEASGLSPDAARRAARAAIPGPLAARQQVRHAGWEASVTSLLADVRVAIRMLARRPLLTAVVVLVIALGSGAVTTIYSAINALVLRPVPGVANADELLTLQRARRNGEVLQQASYTTYRALRDDNRTLDHFAAWGRVALTLAPAGANGVAVLGNMVSASYFDALGVRPAAGRFLTPDEDTGPGAHPVLVVSHGFWQEHLAGDPAAVGRAVSVNGHPFTLIGIAPPGFHGVYTGIRADAWVPIVMQPQLRPRSDLGDSSWLWMFARPRPARDAGAVEGDLTALLTADAQARGRVDGPEAIVRVTATPFSGLPGGEGRTVLGFMALLLGAATIVLAIAGVNVATMLSARYLAREREIAVRAALGAGRFRLLRHLLTEIAVLFVLGALGGFLVALAATTALERLPLPANVPVSLELSPDLRVLAFALAVTTLSGLIFGMAPALRSARRDIVSPLRDDSSRGGTRRGVFSQVLVVGQLALSLVLLVMAGLFIRALDAAQRVDPGFDSDGVIAVTLEPESWGYDEAQARDFYTRLGDRLEGLGGVVSLGYTGRVPLMMGRSPDTITAAGGGSVNVDYASVGVGYFEVLRMPLTQGRPFAPTDDLQAPRVAVVNEALARRVWPQGDVIGRTFLFRDQPTTVVGVARDAKYAYLDEATPSFVYVPLAQVWHPTHTLLLRSATSDVARQVQDAVLALDPRLPPPRVTTLAQTTDIVVLPQRAGAIVTGVLGAAGLLLATIGLYGLVAFAASRRTREIGIRVALGATRGTVVRLMLRDGVKLAAAGVAVGLVLAALAARVLAPYLFAVSALDPIAFLVTAVLFVGIALLASYLPARRAAAANPLDALRAE